MENVKLSLKERLFLQNQYLILEKLYPAGGYAEKRTIVENGYTYHYPDLFNTIPVGGIKSRKKLKKI